MLIRLCKWEELICVLHLQHKEKLIEKSRFEKEKAAIAMKMRLEEDLENRKKLMQEKIYDENSMLEEQDDSQMTDISHETFPGMTCVQRVS